MLKIVLIIVLCTLFIFVNARRIKIQKCCPVDKVIDVNAMKCRESGANVWSPRLYPDELEAENEPEELVYDITTNIPRCSAGVGVHILPLKELKKNSVTLMATKFRLLKSGRLVGKHADGSWINIPASSSCIDGIMNYDDGDSKSYTGEEIDQAVITCPVVS